jgi:hypothetical protein
MDLAEDFQWSVLPILNALLFYSWPTHVLANVGICHFHVKTH